MKTEFKFKKRFVILSLVLGFLISRNLPFWVIGQSEIYKEPSTPEEHIIYIVENYNRNHSNDYLANYTTLNTTNTFIITQLSEYNLVRSIRKSFNSDLYKAELENKNGEIVPVYIDIQLKGNVIKHIRLTQE